MRVILDSSIYISEGYGDSVGMQVLLLTSKVLGHCVCIPVVTVEEVVAKFGRVNASELRELKRKMGTVFKRLNKTLPTEVAEIDLEEETTLFRNRMESTFAEFDCRVLDYPNIPHSELVDRAIKRQPPFDDKGSGYRDALIWESVLELADENDEQIMLLSSDGDFKADKADELHPRLTQELTERGHCETRVLLIRKLSTFIDEHVRPQLTQVFEDNPLSVVKKLNIDIYDAIALEIPAAFFGEEMYPDQWGLPWQYETLYLSSVLDVPQLQIAEAREAETNKFLLKGEVTLECEFDTFVHKADAYIMDDLFIYDPDWNDHYVQAEANLTVECEFSLFVDVSATDRHRVEFLSADITDIRQI